MATEPVLAEDDVFDEAQGDVTPSGEASDADEAREPEAAAESD